MLLCNLKTQYQNVTMNILRLKDFSPNHPSESLNIYVTNITLTGSAMVNWNRRLLIQQTSYFMVSIHALGHCIGEPASISGSRSQEHCKQTRLG